MPSTPLFLSELFRAETAAKSSGPHVDPAAFRAGDGVAHHVHVRCTGEDLQRVPDGDPREARVHKDVPLDEDPVGLTPDEDRGPEVIGVVSSFVWFATICAFCTLKSATNMLSFRLRLFWMMMLSCCVPAVAKRMPALM